MNDKGTKILNIVTKMVDDNFQFVTFSRPPYFLLLIQGLQRYLLANTRGTLLPPYPPDLQGGHTQETKKQ
jgi:hypothetical protein